jgi:ribonucleoside-diphosphate reductase alpha chain
VDQSISKTVNLPEDATILDVENTYMVAWEMGLKGVSVYRDGSRWEQVLYTEKDDDREDKGACPECGNGIVFRDGCRECLSCGWSVCEI